MFNSLFKYYTNYMYKPSSIYLSNIWLFTRLQTLNLTLCNKLIYIIESTKSLKINIIFIQLKNFSFVTFYLSFTLIYIAIYIFYTIF